MRELHPGAGAAPEWADLQTTDQTQESPGVAGSGEEKLADTPSLRQEGVRGG